MHKKKNLKSRGKEIVFVSEILVGEVSGMINSLSVGVN